MNTLQGENREQTESTEYPLCGATCEHRSDLVVHLQVDHPKSEIADTLAETCSGRELTVR
jgi:hypothetical protein